MVGPTRTCRIVDTGVRKELDLQIRCRSNQWWSSAVERPPELDPLEGGNDATRRSIWPAIYPELLELINAHRSTILFVNNRRSAERIALRLNELAGARDRARAPRLARARAAASSIEEMLKAGRAALPGGDLVARARASTWARSISSSRWSRRSRSRAGCSGSGVRGTTVGDVSRGRIFPKFRADLLECAVVARRMREGLIETTVVPRNALDVLAQQIVAIAPPDERGCIAPDRASIQVSPSWTTCTRSSPGPTRTPS